MSDGGSEELRGRVLKSLVERARQKVVGGDEMSDAELIEHYFRYGLRSMELEEMEATGTRPNRRDSGDGRADSDE